MIVLEHVNLILLNSIGTCQPRIINKSYKASSDNTRA